MGKKYYLVGEDIARHEITAEEAREYAGDSDYPSSSRTTGSKSRAAASPRTPHRIGSRSFFRPVRGIG